MKCFNQCSKGKMVQKTGSMTHLMFGKEITIHNVTYMHCETCEYSEYVDEHKVNILIRDAYRSGVSEVYFE